MEEIHFLVQGSSDTPYKVTFMVEGHNMSAYCTCPAGSRGQYCKHRFLILAGESKGIVSDNKNDIETVKRWLPDTDLEAALFELADSEQDLDRAKKRVQAAKKNAARVMND